MCLYNNYWDLVLEVGKRKKWFKKTRKKMTVILFIICIACCTLVLFSALSSYARSTDNYKEVEIIDIVENDGFGGYWHTKSFTIYYKDEQNETSGHISILSSNKFKKKIIELHRGEIIKIKITGGLNYIYDFDVD